MSEQKEYHLELKGMSCGSCESLIKRIASQNGAEISYVDAMSGKVTVSCNENKLSIFKAQLAEKGFVEKENEDERGDPKRIINYIKSIISANENTKVETSLIKYAIASVFALLVSGFLLYFIFPRLMHGLISIIPLIILLILGTVLMLFSYYHISCYRKNLSCSNGMMVGMTVGMMTGFLAGAIVGATNGMFMGSLVGMAFGILQGFLMGKPAGIMGSMEGMMAGIMAGTMGAMLSVMMINDHLLIFLYILFGLCVTMIGALSYMMHREAGPTPATELKIGFSGFALNAAFISVLILIIMIYGPKTGIVFS